QGSKRDEVLALPPWDRAMVGVLRLKFDRDTLYTMSLAEVVQAFEQETFWFGAVSPFSIGYVEQTDLDATGATLTVSTVDGAQVTLRAEERNGVWTIDLIPLFDLANERVEG